MKFEKIKAGMTLYDVGSHKMGNTTMSTVAVWHVQVISVDEEKRTALVFWNGNKATVMHEYQLSRLRPKEPIIIRSQMGYSRIATREEQKAMKEAARKAKS